jgi:predicted ATPase/DNA-binding winged helix-turn-helix (wHTH) protein
MVHAFGDFELDERLCELRRSGEQVHVQPKVFALLLLLAKAAPRVVLKKEIRQRLWRDVTVGEASIWRLVQEARRAIDDDLQQRIVTVRGRGFRFALPVTQSRPGPPLRAAEVPKVKAADTPLVGRDAYLPAALARLERARSGVGGILWLSGERGIGKSTALAAIRQHAEAPGTSVRAAHARPRLDAPPFWAWREALPELERAFPQLGTAPTPSGAAQFSLFHEITRHLTDLSTQSLLVMLFDDLHCADESSLQLLEFLAPALGRTRILVVATYHDASLKSDERTRAITGAMSHPNSAVIPLRPLSLGEIPGLVENATGSRPSEEFAKTLLERSGGNPLYALRILATDWARKSLDATAREHITTMDLPQDAIETISQHLGGISPPALALLTKVAILGSPLDLVKLGVTSGSTTAELHALLDEAVRGHVLRRDRYGQLHFAHRLVRDVLYKRLSSAERSFLHAEAAQKLLAHYGKAYELHLKELAHHFALALPNGDIDRSIELSMRVAKDEGAAGRPLVAARYWQQASRALEMLPGGDVRQLEVTMELAKAWRAAGKEREAEEALVDARILERALGKQS